jgi:POT family proton-dependent oligopeptide transporter
MTPPPTHAVLSHPKGLGPLFFTELWERFSYYGMRALLTPFMLAPAAAGGMGYNVQKTAAIYGTYVMSVYMLSIPGGFFADNFIGARHSVLIGGIVIACGHFTLALQSEAAFFTGLVLIALGTGLLKPNISALVGKLYEPGDTRRDAGFSIFYMGINIGACLSPFVTGWLAQTTRFKSILSSWGFDPNHSWHWGFAAAGVGMTLGLIVYVITGKRLAHVGNSPAPDVPRPWGKLLLVLAGAAALYFIVRLGDTNPKFHWISYCYVIVPVLAILWFGLRSVEGSKHMAAILIFSLCALVFWAIFEQAGSTIAMFGEQLTQRDFLWLKDFPSAWFQSVNSAFVIILAPVFAFLWSRWGERQPSSPMKFVFGLVCLGFSFLLMVPAAKLTAEGKVSPFWIVGLFFLQTIGELCLSPVGLSTMTKLAPKHLVGLALGIWFLAAALGNKLSGVLAGHFDATKPDQLADFFLHQALWVGGFTIVLLACVPWLKRLMGNVK